MLCYGYKLLALLASTLRFFLFLSSTCSSDSTKQSTSLSSIFLQIYSALPSPLYIMSIAYYQYQPTGSLPVNVPGKQMQQPFVPRHSRNSSAYSQLSASPPERPESVSTSGAGLYSSASSNYAGSEYDSSAGATSVDLLDYMNDRLSQAYNPIPLDQNLVKQAQM